MSDYQKAFSLDKKTIFVCGGAGLLGVQVSRAVAACKAKTVILDVDEDKGKKLAKELKAHFHYFDLTDLKNLSHSLKDLVKRYKKIDGWANFSYPKTKDWGRPTGETLDVDFLKTNVDWQLNSYVVASKAVCEMMKKQKQGGSIVNCGSIYGLVGNDFTIYPAAEAAAHLPYSVIKGGLVNFTRYLA
ncbi:MAG TPA: SDR family NAD(P)-dependent oxidoreductase, partial [Candidatus Omnitrophota bacterium]|nr:SDR family NAD(P)-dependent oxidoreductase [Candidatus Omnitrophota bacterium]